MLKARSLIVVLVAVVAITAFPPARAQAFAPPIPIAPPITAICGTPWTAVMCLAVLVIGGTAAIVFSEEVTGLAPAEDGSWCMTDTGHLFQEGSTGYAECTGTIQVQESPALVAEAQEQFTPTAGAPMDVRGSYAWYPTDPEAACVDGVCIIQAISEYIEDEPNAVSGIRTRVEFEVTSGSQCGPGTHLTPDPWNYHNHLRVPYGWASQGGCKVALPAWFVGVDGGVSGNNYMVGNSFLPDSPSCPSGGGGVIRRFNSVTTGHVVTEVRIIDSLGGTCELVMAPRSSDPNGYIAVVTNPASWGGSAPRSLIAMTRESSEYMGLYRGTFQCKDGTTGAVTQRVAEGAQAFVVGDGGHLPSTGCESGEAPIGYELELCDANNPTVCIGVASWALPSGVDEACVLDLASPSPCPLWVEMWTGSEWEVCEPGEANCVGWWNNPARQTQFRCGWGGNYYNASQCETLKNWYDVTEPVPETQLVIVNPNNPSPDTETIEQPGTSEMPGTIGGPATPPSAQPQKTWLQQVITEWSTGSTPSLQNSCWPQGWGLLNPLQWVMRPIMCALTYLFVPTAGITLQLDGLWTHAGTRVGIGTALEAHDLITGLPQPAVGGNCGWGVSAISAPAFDLPAVDLIMCPAELGVTGAASTSRSLGYGALGLWVASMVYRWVHLQPASELQITEAGNGNLV